MGLGKARPLGRLGMINKHQGNLGLLKAQTNLTMRAWICLKKEVGIWIGRVWNRQIHFGSIDILIMLHHPN